MSGAGGKREPVELDEGVTEEQVMDIIRDAVDLAYRIGPTYQRARVNLPATFVDWLYQRASLPSP